MVQIRSFCIVFNIFIEYQNETIYLLIHIVSKWYINHLSRTVYVSIKEMAIILMNQYNQFFKKVVKLSISNLVWYICRSFFGWKWAQRVFQDLCSTGTKAGLQPFSRTVEQILGFSKSFKKLPKSDVTKTVKVWKLKEKGCEKVCKL